MKIWRFYKKPEGKDNAKKNYDLYAMTNHQKFAKYFMNTRNMDKFFLRCSKEDKDTYIKLANDNRDCILDEYELLTRTIDKNGIITHKKVTMIMTFYEYQCSNGGEFQCSITADPEWWTDGPDYTKFNKEIKNALRTLEYISQRKLYSLPFENVKIDSDDDDYSAPDIWVDEVGAFISIFKDTFK